MGSVFISMSLNGPLERITVSDEQTPLLSNTSQSKFVVDDLPPFFDYISHGKTFRSTMKCSLDIVFWMHKYSEITATNWVICKKWKANSYLIHRVAYACYYSPQGPSDCYRDVDCRAKIIITIKAKTESEMLNDPYMIGGFPCVMQYLNAHNHRLKKTKHEIPPEPSEELKEKFETYFDIGMNIKEAIAYHKIDCREAYDRLGNAARPNVIAVRFLYNQWRSMRARLHRNIQEIVANFEAVSISNSNDATLTSDDPNLQEALTKLVEKSMKVCILLRRNILDRLVTLNDEEEGNDVFAELVLLVMRSLSEEYSNQAKYEIWLVLIKYIENMKDILELKYSQI